MTVTTLVIQLHENRIQIHKKMYNHNEKCFLEAFKVLGEHFDRRKKYLRIFVPHFARKTSNWKKS